MVLSIVRDVTEQRAAQEALRRNDQQLRSIVESVRDYAIYLLDRDGYVMTWNPGAERIKGYTGEEILGHALLPLLYPGGQPTAAGRRNCCGWRRSAAAWKKKAGGCARTDRASGPMRSSRRSATTPAQLTGYAKVTRDFTDRKRAEEAVMLQLSGRCWQISMCASCWGPFLRKHPRGDSARRGHAGPLRPGKRCD